MCETLTYNGTVYRLPFADLLPPLTPEERAALTADIRENGVTYPIVVTPEDEVIDGHNRLAIAAELQLPPGKLQYKVVHDLTPERKRQTAYGLNLKRRHLSREHVRQYVAAMLTVNPDRSDRAIAREAGVSDKTVAAVRRQAAPTAEIPQLRKRVGRDGKARAVKPVTPKPAPVPRSEAGASNTSPAALAGTLGRSADATEQHDAPAAATSSSPADPAPQQTPKWSELGASLALSAERRLNELRRLAGTRRPDRLAVLPAVRKAADGFHRLADRLNEFAANIAPVLDADPDQVRPAAG